MNKNTRLYKVTLNGRNLYTLPMTYNKALIIVSQIKAKKHKKPINIVRVW